MPNAQFAPNEIKNFTIVADSVDISSMVLQLDIFQELFTPTWSAQLSFVDTQNLLMNIPIKPGTVINITLETDYPENANRAKVFFVATLILIQVTLLAGESSFTIKDSGNTGHGYSENTKYPGAQDSGNVRNYLIEEAVEDEIEIEDWMYNTQHSFWLDLDDAEESELAIEDWMCNTQHSFWLDLDDAEESELAIESWMTNPNDWIKSGDELMLTSKE